MTSDWYQFTGDAILALLCIISFYCVSKTVAFQANKAEAIIGVVCTSITIAWLIQRFQ